jgi:hypothetical protein
MQSIRKLMAFNWTAFTIATEGEKSDAAERSLLRRSSVEPSSSSDLVPAVCSGLKVTHCSTYRATVGVAAVQTWTGPRLTFTTLIM